MHLNIFRKKKQRKFKSVFWENKEWVTTRQRNDLFCDNNGVARDILTSNSKEIDI